MSVDEKIRIEVQDFVASMKRKYADTFKVELITFCAPKQQKEGGCYSYAPPRCEIYDDKGGLVDNIDCWECFPKVQKCDHCIAKIITEVMNLKDTFLIIDSEY